MSDHNPYAAPQATFSPSVNRSINSVVKPLLSSDFIRAAEGARYTYFAFGLISLYIMANTAFAFANSSFFSFLIIVSPLLNLIAQIFCCIGWKKLSKMPKETGAGHWFKWSFYICFSEILIVLGAIIWGMAVILNNTSNNVQLVILTISMMMNVLKYSFALIGMQKIKLVLNDKKLYFYIIISSCTLAITTGIQIVFYLLFSDGIINFMFIYLLLTSMSSVLTIMDIVMLAWVSAMFLFTICNALAYKRIYDQSDNDLLRPGSRTSFVDPHILKLGK